MAPLGKPEPHGGGLVVVFLSSSVVVSVATIDTPPPWTTPPTRCRCQWPPPADPCVPSVSRVVPELLVGGTRPWWAVVVACGAWEAWLVRASSARPTDGSAEAFGVSEELTGELYPPQGGFGCPIFDL